VRVRVAAIATLVLLGCGCGGFGASAPTTAEAPFAWLDPTSPPSTWHTARTATGAVLSYPGSWQRIGGDPGSVSAARTGAGGVIVGYLNATPAVAAEASVNWARFRVRHNAEEGDRDVHLIAQARGLRFGAGRGACVIDRYRTARSAYVEIACLVGAPGSPSTVVVAAAQEAMWTAEQADLHRAIAAFRT
jgi:hypothetical protein